MMVAKLFRLFDSPSSSSTASWSLTATLFYYTRLYGAQLVLLTLLSAVTIYRREMSCNHVYTEAESVAIRKRCLKNVNSPELADKFEESTEELLEGAGAFCSGEPLYSVLLSLSLFFDWLLRDSVKDSQWVSLLGTKQTAIQSKSFRIVSNDCFTRDLPADVQVHVFSFLHPKDVISFSCSSRSTLAIVNDGAASTAIWRTLWYRDYAWLVHSWNVGMDAMRRSQPFPEQFDKEFYFMFGQAYLNYVLAGKNTLDQCLIGLHGHVYDLTPFLHSHPGSPETVMVHAGKDASRYFEDMTHSAGARRVARSLCVAVNGFCNEEGCGVQPTTLTSLGPTRSHPTVASSPTIEMARTRAPARPETLQLYRNKYQSQERLMLQSVQAAYSSNPDVLSDVNAFYDPFQRQWKAWYTSAQFETIFVSDI